MTTARKCNKIPMLYAEVAELVDAHGSGPCESNLLRVQVPSSAFVRNISGMDIHVHPTYIFHGTQKCSVNPRVHISGHWGVPLGWRRATVHWTVCAPSSAFILISYVVNDSHRYVIIKNRTEIASFLGIQCRRAMDHISDTSVI